MKYTSPGSGKQVPFQAYLAELLVERKAQYEGTKLPKAYWKNPEYIMWNKELKKQIFGVLKLLKLYPSQVIYKTFLNNEWVYSAHSPKFQDLVREEYRKYKLRSPTKPINIVTETEKVSKKFGKKSKKARLND